MDWLALIVKSCLLVLLFRVILVLFGINSEALSYKFNVNPINVLNESGNWWQDLLRDVPVVIELKLTFRAENLIGVICLVSQLWVLLVCLERLFADDIWNEVVDQLSLRLALTLLPNRNSHVRQTLDIRVLSNSPGQLLSDDVLSERYLV